MKRRSEVVFRGRSATKRRFPPVSRRRPKAVSAGAHAAARWLTGTLIGDPVTGQPRTSDDLGRRKTDLKAIVCSGRSELRRDDLRAGIRRVH